MEKTQNNFQMSDKQFYKGKFHIAFYTDDQYETYFKGFDTLYDLCEYLNLPITKQNINKLRLKIYLAVKKENHHTRLLGQTLRVYLVNMCEIIN